MGYALFWCEHLAFWLLLFAFVTAACSRIERKLGRWLLAAVSGLFTLLFLIAPSVVAVAVRATAHIPLAIAWPYLTLAVLAVTGGTFLALVGRRRDDQGRPAAREWPIGSLAAATGVVLLLHGMTLWNLDLAMRQQMDALRVEVTALAVSAAPPHAQDRENAALLYRQAMDGGLLEQRPEKHTEWLTSLVETPDSFNATDAEFVAYMKKRASALNLVREAARLPSCSFPREWGRPSIDTVIADTNNLRAVTRELTLDARFRAAAGDVHGALEDILAIFQIADHVGQEPLLVTQFVSYAIQAIACNSLESTLRSFPVTAQDLTVFDAWRPMAVSPRLQRSLRGEEAYGLATLCRLGEGRELETLGPGIDIQGFGPNTSAFYRVFLFSDDLKSYRLLMATAQRAAILKHTERLQALQQVEGSLSSTPIGIMARLLLPALVQSSHAVVRAEANGRLAHLAIAVQRYRVQKGDYPESLERLEQDTGVLIPRDPYNGETIRYRRQEGEALLYCVGPDGQDDQGTPLDAESKFGDIVFRLSVSK